MYAKVLIEYGVKSLDKTFTYRIPASLKDALEQGMKVVVPFGSKIVHGFVLEISNAIEENDYELKSIYRIEDPELKLNEELLLLGKYLQEQTLCSLITAYQTMLPRSLKVKEKEHHYEKYETWISLSKSGLEVEEYIADYPNRKKQIMILKALQEKEALKKDLKGEALNTLTRLGFIKEEKRQIYRLGGVKSKSEKVTLTEDQEHVISTIIRSSGSQTFLIHGVTGSGKTEVYMHLIEDVLKKGKTALFLVPEISLTAQMTNRFYERFGSDVAIFHSALSEGEKYDEYLKILRGEVRVVVGTRSAIFVPLQNIGIIIMDEEHSENYKQDSTPRYHALDMAEYRSKYHKIPLVLGSATPSLESMARAKKDVYTLLLMPKRITNAELPVCTIVDMAEEMKQRNMIFSNLLKEKINDRLQKNEQVILLLNRRGFSTIITCQNCGFTYKCPHCDISLTYHKTSNHLRCHYCGYTVIKPDECPECHEKSLNYLGLGTEKLESEIEKLFPHARVLRMDMDTTTKKGAHAKMIEAFSNHEYDILLGTQMISKGFDFPLVSLVGIMNADTSLNIPDFRSGERTFALLSQASGRAGRSNIKGEVIIQTFNPDNQTLQCVKNHDYETFYQNEMKIRKTLSYPPYYYLASIKVVSKDYEMARDESLKVASFLKKNLSLESKVIGPTTAAMFKVNNTYRFHILIKYRFDDKLKTSLQKLDELYVTNRGVYLEIDLSPRMV